MNHQTKYFYAINYFKQYVIPTAIENKKGILFKNVFEYIIISSHAELLLYIKF